MAANGLELSCAAVPHHLIFTPSRRQLQRIVSLTKHPGKNNRLEELDFLILN